MQELRAYLDGTTLAALEESHQECADLEGFDRWVRKKLKLKGYFRWEQAILAEFSGNEVVAFGWAARELKAFAGNAK